jgi:hypothetical protein
MSIELRLDDLYQQRLDDISSQYQAGGLGWLKANMPEHYNLIDQTWDKLNEIWNKVLGGQTCMPDFIRILNEWHRAQIKGITFFSCT